MQMMLVPVNVYDIMCEKSHHVPERVQPNETERREKHDCIPVGILGRDSTRPNRLYVADSTCNHELGWTFNYYCIATVCHMTL